MDVAERVSRWGRGRRASPAPKRSAGAEMLEVDGLVLAISNLPDPALSSVVVEARPSGSGGGSAAAEAEFARRGLQFGMIARW